MKPVRLSDRASPGDFAFFVRHRLTTPALTDPQMNFLSLHKRRDDPPMRWQWVFCESMLRAITDRGAKATITAQEFKQLIGWGLMRPVGLAGAELTDSGRAVAV